MSLDTASLVVQPGAEASCQVQVRNTGQVVDQFAVEVLGDAAAWSTVDPPVVNLLPGGATSVTVRFHPPRSPAVRAGAVPFGVLVRSREDADGSVVEEGVVEVAPFAELAADLVPSTSRGRRRGDHLLAVDNLGNHPLDVELTVEEPGDVLRFDLDRPALRIEPGTAEFARLRVRPVGLFTRGPDRTHPFQVIVRQPDLQPLALPGSLVQRALLPKWLLPALGVLLALLAAAIVLWFTVLKPAVKSAAREAATEQAQQVTAVAQDARQRVMAAEKKVDDAISARTPQPGTPQPGTPGGGGPNQPGAAAVAFRIASNAGPGTFNRFSADPPLPADKTLLVTDLVLQNPFGDSGIVQILRGEDEVLLEVGLNNFRDLDYHYVQALRFTPDKPVMFAVRCQNPAGNCRPSASFSGRLEG